MEKRSIVGKVAVGVLASCAVTSASAGMHATDEFESGATRPVSIAFLPPHVMVTQKRIVQSEAQIEESTEWSTMLGQSVASQFTAQGYDVRILSPDQINSDPELQELVLDADRRYQEMLTQVAMRLPRQIGKHRYQAGDEMRALAARLGVDAIGFADMQLVASAAGASAVAVLVGIGSAGSQTMMSVSVIDGKTANIEAYFVPPIMRRGSMMGYDAIMEDPAGKIAQMTELTLKELPAADASARVEVAEDSEDVLSDVESLLEN
jgi:hypothetical protein